MKKKITILTVTLLALMAASVLAQTGVQALHLRKINDETVLKIDLSGSFQFSHQAVVAKDSKPYRIIVDLFPAVHKLGQKVYSQLPPSLVTAIRTSQYAVKPDNVVRIVLDLREQAVYRIEKSGEFVFIYIPDNSPAFADWSSGQKYLPEVSKPAETNEPASPVNESQPAPEQTASATTDIQPQPSPETPQEPVIAENIEPAVTETPVTVETYVENNDESSQPATVESFAENNDAETPVEEYQPYQSGSLPRQSSFFEAESAREFYVMQNQRTEPVAETPAVAEVGTAVEEVSQNLQAESTEIQQPVVAEVAASPVQQTPDSAPVQQVIPNETPQVAETKTTDSAVKPAEVALKSQDLYHDTGVLVQEISPDDLPAIDPTALAQVSIDDSTGQKPTSRFRKEGFFPAKLKGTLVAEFPQRMVIEYAPGVFRDPFETLINESKKSEGPTEKRIPDVETSRLVGVLEASSGKNRALLEDLDGYGYILKAGDKVKKGYVERIDSDKAFFQLFEYGWSRTIALYLGRN